MTWTKKELLPPIPPEIQPLLDDITNASSTVIDVLNGFSSALEVAKLFFIAGNDLFAVIMDIIIQAIEDLINDLFGAGLFQLVVNPFTIGSDTLRRARVDNQFNISIVTPDDAIKLAIKSLDDPGDIDPASITPDNPLGNLKRPNFSAGSTVAGFGLLVTAKDINAYIEILSQLAKVWQTSDIEFAISQANKATVPAIPRSTGADWDSLRVNQIGSLGSIQNQLLKMLALTKGYTLVPGGVVSLIEALQRKADDLSNTLEVFQAVFDDLTNIQALAGVHVLDIPPQVGGNDLLKASLPNPVIQGPDSFIFRYTMFLMYVGGGPSGAHPQVKAADTLRKLVT